MAVHSLHVVVDENIFNETPGNLCISREFNGETNTVFQAFSSHTYLGTSQSLGLKNKFQWSDEFELVVTRSFSSGVKPLDDSYSRPVSPGQTCQWVQDDLSSAKLANNLPHGTFGVENPPQNLCVAAKMRTGHKISYAYVRDTCAQPHSCKQTTALIEPSNNYLLFWSSKLNDGDMFDSQVQNGLLLTISPGTQTKHIRYGFAIPNRPFKGEIAAWYEYGHLGSDKQHQLNPKWLSPTHAGTSVQLTAPTVYAPVNVAHHEGFRSYLTERFAYDTKQNLLHAQHIFTTPAIRIRCTFDDNKFTKETKIQKVGAFMLIDHDPSLSVNIESIKNILVFTVAIKVKSPSFCIVKGASDIEKMITLIANQIRTISQEWRPIKTEICPVGAKHDYGSDAVVQNKSSTPVVPPISSPPRPSTINVSLGNPSPQVVTPLYEQSAQVAEKLLPKISSPTIRALSPVKRLPIEPSQIPYQSLENETELEEHVEQPEEYEPIQEPSPSFWIKAHCHWPSSTTFPQAAAGFVYTTNALKKCGYVVEEKSITDTPSGVIQSYTTFGPGTSWQGLKRDWIAAVAANKQSDGHFIPPNCFVYLSREKTPEGNYITHEVQEGSKEWKQYLVVQQSPRSPVLVGPFGSPPYSKIHSDSPKAVDQNRRPSITNRDSTKPSPLLLQHDADRDNVSVPQSRSRNQQAFVHSAPNTPRVNSFAYTTLSSVSENVSQRRPALSADGKRQVRSSSLTTHLLQKGVQGVIALATTSAESKVPGSENPGTEQTGWTGPLDGSENKSVNHPNHAASRPTTNGVRSHKGSPDAQAVELGDEDHINGVIYSALEDGANVEAGKVQSFVQGSPGARKSPNHMHDVSSKGNAVGEAQENEQTDKSNPSMQGRNPTKVNMAENGSSNYAFNSASDDSGIFVTDTEEQNGLSRSPYFTTEYTGYFVDDDNEENVIYERGEAETSQQTISEEVATNVASSYPTF